MDLHTIKSWSKTGSQWKSLEVFRTVAGPFLLGVVYLYFVAATGATSDLSELTVVGTISADLALLAGGVLAISMGGRLVLPVKLLTCLIAYLYLLLAILASTVRGEVSLRSLVLGAKVIPIEQYMTLARSVGNPSVVVGLVAGVLGITWSALFLWRFPGSGRSVRIATFSVVSIVAIQTVVSGRIIFDPLLGGVRSLLADPLRANRDYIPSVSLDRSRELVDRTGGSLVTSKLPNILIVVMESLNGNFVGRSVNGVKLTPTLDTLRKSSRSFTNFYGNSVYSFAGLVATLGGIFPHPTRDWSSLFPSSSKFGFCHALRPLGYTNVIFIAADNPSFFPTNIFNGVLGLDQVIPMDDRIIEEADRQYFGLWGLRDDRFYKRVLKTIDSFDSSRPFCAIVANGSNHAPFLVSEDERRVFHHPLSPEERYCDSLNFADRCLIELDPLVKNGINGRETLLVILGDHGFPMGENGMYYNVAGATPSHFRNYCLIRFPARILPAESGKICSQIDIGTTLLDIIGVASEYPTRGVSLLRDDVVSGFAFCQQPFGKGYYVVIGERFMYKYCVDNGAEAFVDRLTGVTAGEKVLQKERLEYIDIFRSGCYFIGKTYGL